MSKPVSKTNPNLVDLIGDLKAQSRETGAAHLCGEMSHYASQRAVVTGHNQTLAA